MTLALAACARAENTPPNVPGPTSAMPAPTASTSGAPQAEAIHVVPLELEVSGGLGGKSSLVVNPDGSVVGPRHMSMKITGNRVTDLRGLVVTVLESGRRLEAIMPAKSLGVLGPDGLKAEEGTVLVTPSGNVVRRKADGTDAWTGAKVKNYKPEMQETAIVVALSWGYVASANIDATLKNQRENHLPPMPEGNLASAPPNSVWGSEGDRDKDGIKNELDACPDVPGIGRQSPKTNGCPPDRDGDGIADDDDACPDQYGIRNVPAKNGCPP